MLRATAPVVLDCASGEEYARPHLAEAIEVAYPAIEACSGRFGGRLLVVATGRSAMQGTPMLARIAGRFTVQVALSDTDVTQVIRQVVLRKRPDREATLATMLGAVSGEIDRQLCGSKIEPSSADAPALPADYPFLPARRRLWERLLRATDRAGTSGQLRNQLRITHEAASAVAAVSTASAKAKSASARRYRQA